MREKRSRKKVVAAVAVALVMVGGAAFAYWTLSGQGEGSVATQNTKKPLVITQASLGTVAPGETIQLSGSIVNNNNTSVKVGVLTPTIKSPGIANESDFVLGGKSNSDGVLIPGNTTLQWSGLTLRYIDSETENQDAGMGANVVLSYNLGAYVAAPSGYNAIPSPMPGNVSSYGPEAYSFSEFGNRVALGGTGRKLQSMSVVLSSWGCGSGTWNGPSSTTPTAGCLTATGATFDVPVTLKIYADNNGVAGAVLATKLETVQVAYRPSASTECTGANVGKWYNESTKTCHNGIPQTVTMTMTAQNPLPDHVIWTASYNTTNYGPSPLGSQACYVTSGGCGYDGLNIGAQNFTGAPSLGTDLTHGQAFFKNAAYPNGTTAAIWYDGEQPLGAIATK